MIKGREHFEYGNMHLTLNGATGEILELYTKRNYDNLMKNSMFDIHQPFTLTFDDGRTVFPLDNRQVTDNRYPKVDINCEEKSDGLLVSVIYGYVTDGTEIIAADIVYTAYIHSDDIVFNITVNNTFGSMLREVRFPVLPGIYLGNTPEDDVLVYPLHTGRKLVDPMKEMSKPLKCINWRWLDYRYTYTLDGMVIPPELSKLGLRGLRGTYPNGLCMSWLDMYDGDGGIYFGIHDPSAKPVTIEAACIGENRPGMVFAAGYSPRTKDGGVFVSPPCVTALHDGDWHKGAMLYREFRLPHIEFSKRRIPEWAKTNPGLHAHYDFKYQTGEVTHTYKDIPEMARMALADGFNHMLFAGWQLGGHDGGIPLYIPDPDLGTEDELIAGIAEAKKLGVHVTFYVNFKQANVLYNTDKLKERAVTDEKGEIAISYFGNTNNKFANMCPASVQWKEEILRLCDRLTNVYGADGIYFDVLAAGGAECFNPHHDHDFDGYAKGKLEIMKAVREAFEATHDDTMMIMGEWTSDTLGGVMTYQLNQLFFDCLIGGYPAMFAYTFPEFGSIDVVYPTKNLSMRPVFVAQNAKSLMADHLTNGSAFWVYDLVDVNTFTKDNEGHELLLKLIDARRTLLEKYPDALFRDTDGIASFTDNVKVSRFECADNTSVLVGFRYGGGYASVTLDDGRVIVLPDEDAFVVEI